jgi:hypothetical protein
VEFLCKRRCDCSVQHIRDRPDSSLVMQHPVAALAAIRGQRLRGDSSALNPEAIHAATVQALAKHEYACCQSASLNTGRWDMRVNQVVADALHKLVSEHIAGNEATSEVRLRHASDDCCGVFYSVTYAREAGAADATIAVRTSWPWELCSNVRLKQIMPRLIQEGPPGLDLSATSSSSAIVAWLLEASDTTFDQMQQTIRWLASIRCARWSRVLQALVYDIAS